MEAHPRGGDRDVAAGEKAVLCDLAWKGTHANPGVLVPVVRMGLGGKCWSLAAIR